MILVLRHSKLRLHGDTSGRQVLTVSAIFDFEFGLQPILVVATMVTPTFHVDFVSALLDRLGYWLVREGCTVHGLFLGSFHIL